MDCPWYFLMKPFIFGVFAAKELLVRKYRILRAMFVKVFQHAMMFFQGRRKLHRTAVSVAR